MPASSFEPQPASRTRGRFLVLAMLCSLAFLTYLDRICIMRVQGDIERDLHFDHLTVEDEQWLRSQNLENDPKARAKLSESRGTERMSWVFSAFVAGYVLFEIPGGWLGDVLGARAVIFRIVLWWSVFTGLTGGIKWIATSFSDPSNPGLLLAVMVTIRFLFGVGEAGAYPNIARALGRWFPVQERATAQSFIWFSSRMGGAAAPAIIAGLMALSGGWSQAFWLLGLIGILWAGFFFFWFRDRPEDKSSVNSAESSFIRGEAAPGTIYDDALLPPLKWSALLTPNLLCLDLAQFCVSFCFYFYITFLPKYLKEQFHIEYSQSQLLTGLPLLLGGFACLAGGKLSDLIILRTSNRRWGRSLPPILGWSAAGLCALLVSQLHSAGAVIVVLCLAFACQDLGVPSTWSLPADVGGRYAGTVAGCMNAAGAVGGMLSPLMAAKISIAYGWNSTFVIFGIVYLIGAAAWLRVNATEPLVRPAISSRRAPPPGPTLLNP